MPAIPLLQTAKPTNFTSFLQGSFSGEKSPFGNRYGHRPRIPFHELQNLESQGLDWRGRVFIADRAHIVIPAYKAMDLEMEKERIRPIGTTGRGIGIAYAQKAHQGRDPYYRPL
jgi:adenylosuccinate synthase